MVGVPFGGASWRTKAQGVARDPGMLWHTAPRRTIPVSHNRYLDQFRRAEEITPDDHRRPQESVSRFFPRFGLVFSPSAFQDLSQPHRRNVFAALALENNEAPGRKQLAMIWHPGARPAISPPAASWTDPACPSPLAGNRTGRVRQQIGSVFAGAGWLNDGFGSVMGACSRIVFEEVSI